LRGRHATCPHCSAPLDHETKDGRIKLMFKKAAVMSSRKGAGGEFNGEARCPSCNGDVVLPVRLVIPTDQKNTEA